MRSLAPSRSLVRRANQFKTLGLLVGAGGIFVLALAALLFVIPLAASGTPSYSSYLFIRSFILALGLLALAAAFLIELRAFTWRTDNDAAVTLAGLLAPLLDDRYTLVRNVSKLEIALNHYIDAVLVGPPGVIVLRLVDVTGLWVNEGAHWMEQDRRRGLVPARFNPTLQTIDDIKRLSAYLTRHNLPDVPVYGYVVFMKDPPAVELRAKDPQVQPVHARQLHAALQTQTRERLDAARCAAVVRILVGE